MLRILFFIFLCQTAWAELTIEIKQGQDNAVPVAVVPFALNGFSVEEKDAFHNVIAADLARSGQFKPIAVGDMLSRPTEGKEVYFHDWRMLNIEYLLIGRAHKKEDGKVGISFDLYDVQLEKKLINNHSLSVAEKSVRRGAHYISDKMYETITGIRGAFSSKILYVVRERRGDKLHFTLQYADADGFNYRTILESEEPILSPSWSPDGKNVAYVSFEQGDSSIWVQELATGRRYRLAHFKGHNGAPDWSPDGKKMAMVLSKDGNSEIYVMDIASRELTRITDHHKIDTEPRWTPEGDALIFTSNRSGSAQIYRHDLKTGKNTRLTFVGKYNARPAITPDGRYLIMVHRNKTRNFQIAVQDLKTKAFYITTETELDESPSVAPNGSMLIYATKDAEEGVLAAVSIDGKVKFRLPSKRGTVREPAWSPYL